MATSDRMEHYGKIALDVLRREMGSFVVEIQVREDDDHSGEPSLFFVAMLDGSAPVDLADRFIRGQLALSNALAAEEETRFPYLQTRRPPGAELPEDYYVRFRADLARKRSVGR